MALPNYRCHFWLDTPLLSVGESVGFWFQAASVWLPYYGIHVTVWLSSFTIVPPYKLRLSPLCTAMLGSILEWCNCNYNSQLVLFKRPYLGNGWCAVPCGGLISGPGQTRVTFRWHRFSFLSQTSRRLGVSLRQKFTRSIHVTYHWLSEIQTESPVPRLLWHISC